MLQAAAIFAAVRVVDHNIAQFTFVPQADATLVTWATYGPAPFPSKLMLVFIKMDQMIGRDFEAGLVNPKKLTEK
jgi:hypothetical protein